MWSQLVAVILNITFGVIWKLVLKYEQIYQPVVNTYKSKLLVKEEGLCQGLHNIMYKILQQILQAPKG